MQDYEIQRSPSWHAFRKNHLGSSDCSAIMGVSPWKTQLELYNEKTSDTIEESVSNFAMRRGVELEPLALAKFEAETGYLMTPRVLTHPVYSMLSASLDGLEIESKCAVEIKCSGKVDHALALKGQVPEKYMPQLQHIMFVTNLPEIYYMSYVSDEDFIIFKVKQDHDYTTKLLAAELEFWNRIQDRNPPEPSDKDVAKIESDEWRNLSDEYKQNKLKLDFLEREQDRIREQLIFLANDKSAQGCGLQLTKYVRKGNICYSKIPELVGLDLEVYRGKSTEAWRISIQGENE